MLNNRIPVLGAKPQFPVQYNGAIGGQVVTLNSDKGPVFLTVGGMPVLMHVASQLAAGILAADPNQLDIPARALGAAKALIAECQRDMQAQQEKPNEAHEDD